MIITPTQKEQEFIDAYLEAVDFTETGDTDQPDNGAELDETFMRESVIDCLAFYGRICCYLSDDHIGQAGHDFWLTRNGHGAGFWDRPELYSQLHADKFTKISEQYGEAHAYFEGFIS